MLEQLRGILRGPALLGDLLSPTTKLDTTLDEAKVTVARVVTRRRPAPLRTNCGPTPSCVRRHPSTSRFRRNNRSRSLFRLGRNAISPLTVKKTKKTTTRSFGHRKDKWRKERNLGPFWRGNRRAVRGGAKASSKIMSRKHAVMAQKSPGRERRGLPCLVVHGFLETNSLSGHVRTAEGQRENLRSTVRRRADGVRVTIACPAEHRRSHE